jgi:CyaY protein
MAVFGTKSPRTPQAKHKLLIIHNAMYLVYLLYFLVEQFVLLFVLFFERIFFMTSRINLSETSDFLPRAQAVLNQLELILEQIFEALDLDIDIERTGGVLNIYVNTQTTLVINLQSPMQQIWLATPYGGFHYTWNNQDWLNTRGGLSFYAQLAHDLSIITGKNINININIINI